MAEHIKLGQLGEMLAKQYLQARGLKILEENWRHKRSEIDIIAKDDDVVVFVEVKTRRSSYFGYPEEQVHEKKQDQLLQAAEEYLEQNNINSSLRFDIISVIVKDGAPEIHHITDAFFPTSD